MSKKKHPKKRHTQSTAAVKRRATEEAIADYKDRDRKRMKPLARNILLGDLVLLAATQLMMSNEIITETTGSILTLVGVGLLMLALYIQFGGGGQTRRSL